MRRSTDFVSAVSKQAPLPRSPALPSRDLLNKYIIQDSSPPSSVPTLHVCLVRAREDCQPGNESRDSGWT
jgi:hypothetical protein